MKFDFTPSLAAFPDGKVTNSMKRRGMLSLGSSEGDPSTSQGEGARRKNKRGSVECGAEGEADEQTCPIFPQDGG